MKVGFSKIIITPDLENRKRPLQLAGYSPRELCSGVHDDLYARAVYLEGVEDDINTHLLMIVCDIVSIDGAFTNIVKKYISKKLPILEDNILISATHTHHGPDYWGVFRPGRFIRFIQGFISPRPEVRELFNLGKKLLKVANKAYIKRIKARLGIAQAEIQEKDRVMINRNSPFDFEKANYPVTVIKVIDERDQTQGLIVNYACHGTSIPRENTLITADYVAYLIKSLEDHFKNQSVHVVYFNGPCGEINPLSMELKLKMENWDPSKFNYADIYNQNGTWADAERIGTTIAEYAIKTLNDINYQDIADIKVLKRNVKIPVKDYDYGSDLKSGMRRLLYRVKCRLIKSLVKRNIVKKNIFFKNVLGEYVNGIVQVIKIGDIIIGTAPGEYYLELGKEVIDFTRSIYPKTTPIIIELVNDSLGYFYSISAYMKGGYESAFSITPLGGRILTMKLKQYVKELDIKA